MRTGIATVPLDYGKCPRWLFERMKRLARGIIITTREEFSPEEVLKRFADPVWFQSLGCVIGFDWNSSGLTTTTMGAVKTALFDIQDRLGIFICGGKGKTSRKTPEEIEAYGISRGFSFASDLIYASKMAAKVDSALIQDNYQIYHHNFLFTNSGNWAVIQQGLNTQNQTARRYHWLSSNVSDFTEEPHSGIISGAMTKPLNLIAKKSRKNKEIAVELVEEPKQFLKDIKLVSNNSNSLIRQKRLPQFAEMELNDVEFHYHPVLREKFDLKRLNKIIEKTHFFNPQSFTSLLSLEGVGPKTIRALSLVAEIIYGAKPSYDDPARYTFAHGGKDGTPYFPRPEEIDKTIKILEKGILRSQISIREKAEAQRRLNSSFN